MTLCGVVTLRAQLTCERLAEFQLVPHGSPSGGGGVGRVIELRQLRAPIRAQGEGGFDNVGSKVHSLVFYYATKVRKIPDSCKKNTEKVRKIFIHNTLSFSALQDVENFFQK